MNILLEDCIELISVDESINNCDAGMAQKPFVIKKTVMTTRTTVNLHRDLKKLSKSAHKLSQLQNMAFSAG